MTKDNRFLDEFRLYGLRPAPRGAYGITVTFDINEEGVLTVTAVDDKTGNMGDVTITNFNQYLSKDEILRLQENEERYKREKHESSQTQNARHTLESFCFEKLREFKSNMLEGHSDKEFIIEKCLETIDWIDKNPLAPRSDFENQLKEMEELCECFMSNVIVL
ncbi:unnamed protein product [Bursaphelenchus okinawaensis]|uniref:Heat shock protein 70 n=1 Tax=Bursaphelenchus okinawaensis TaxID=465554 RepID=A0A811KTE4_9BILA|nr:unnamed protein product [Bursaphelenchus okinawaensis]CAG9112500.1 unnamed protein product [Bursaphelenchus okinawaensis]